MEGPTGEASLRAFMGLLPPAPRMRVVEFTQGRTELDSGRVAGMETIFEQVTGQSPAITLDHARSDAVAYADRSLSGIWCGRPRTFTAARDAWAALEGFHRALTPHGALHLDMDRPRWESAETADELLGILRTTGFRTEQVDCAPTRIRVLAMKTWRCCDDGPRQFHDTHAVW
ncbi:hypothetical protein [Streptomyces parvus]|uniref:hypothetical protein n=1 Tax=Streptomyces parvus TaxID=66428 RepID=UPI0021013742|nr:hypothetical protein [Streptomyces parvus]MCQ1575877.1 hypothetical protein [Streptomyces parvus]